MKEDIKIVLLFIAVIAIMVGVIFLKGDQESTQGPSSFSNDLPPPPVNQIQPIINITNPDYVASPSTFIIDKKGIVPYSLQTNKQVWVERIVNENTLEVSWSMESEGRKILKVVRVSLLNLDSYENEDNFTFRVLRGVLPPDMYPTNIDCMRPATLKVLEPLVLYHYVSLFPSNDQFTTGGIRVVVDNIDVGGDIIRKGFGVLGNSSIEDALWPERNPYYYSLKNKMQVARLENIGIWSLCPIIVKKIQN